MKQNKEQNTWTVRWNRGPQDTFLYGSEVRFENGDVAFENPLMPPGAVIHEWRSKTNFRRDRIEPTLPLIDGEGAYHIHVDMDVPEGEICLIRIVSFDRYEEEVESFISDEKEFDFHCPIQTYSYRIQLINGGVTRFHFHAITIKEI